MEVTMSHRIKVAAIQMDTKSAHLNERLEKAELLANRVAESGTQLVGLPELFNIRYSTDSNIGL